MNSISYPTEAFISHYESISSADLTNGLHYSGLRLNLQWREVTFLHFYGVCVHVCVRVYMHVRVHCSTREWPDNHFTSKAMFLVWKLLYYSGHVACDVHVGAGQVGREGWLQNSLHLRSPHLCCYRWPLSPLVWP